MADSTKTEQLVETEQALLFVYGTLLRGFENASFLSSPEKASLLCTGKIHGRLYDLGPYPAFIRLREDDGRRDTVKGEIYQIHDPLVLFETLDLVEGYNHQRQQESLFVREKVTAETEAGIREVWVYV